MKNKKRITALLFAVSFGLVVIPYAVMAQDGTTESLDDEYINLGKLDSYTVKATTKVPDAAVKSVTITRAGESVGEILSQPGDYKVELNCEEVIYDYNVFCYRRGDANIDGSCNVKDLVAAHRRNAHAEISAEYGADMDGDKVVDATDYDLLRKLLIGKELVLPEAGDKVGKYMIISAVDLSDNELSITFTNTSKVWEAGADSYVEFTYYDADSGELSTQKVELGIIEPGSTATCKLTLPSGTANVKATRYDFDYWSSVVK